MSNVDSRLIENLLLFSRLLRAAGLPVGTGAVMDAARAVELVGLSSQTDFYTCLASQFVNRAEQRILFDQAFHLFWRNPKIMERLLSAMLPMVQSPDQRQEDILKRLSDALGTDNHPPDEADSQQIEIDARFSTSAREVLQEKDFEQMSAEELAEAKAQIANLKLPIHELTTRRFQSLGHSGQVDLRKTLRDALRHTDFIPLKFKKPKTRKPTLVVLCDISGSMTQYSRMFLHFMHAVTNDQHRVHSFLFGTRLSNVSRHLAHKDIDIALAKTSGSVQDWSGGTRIGYCLGQFNRHWSRRVLGQGAITLLITDGLERDDAEQLEREMARLSRSSKRLIWLNPLLRFDQFEPKAQGIRAMLPFVDDFAAAHNIRSFTELISTLSGRAGSNTASAA